MSLTRLSTLAQCAAWTLAAVWTLKSISVARNLRRVPNLLSPEWDSAPQLDTTVAVVIPARNEAGNVEPSIRSLLHQQLPGLHLVAVNDRSTDQTAAELNALAAQHPDQLTTLHITGLPSGWLGKTHAMHTGAAFALDHHNPDWLLFTDADVLFHPEALRRALAFAISQQADHVVVMPSPILRSIGEAVFLGFLQIVGFWALRPWRVPDPHSRDALGVGAFNLLSSSAYHRLGGLGSLRLQVVEDVALGRRVKRLGLRQRLAFAPGYVRLHWAPGIGGILRTMTKNLFAIYCYNLPLVLVSSAALLVLCLGPFAGLFSRKTRTPSSLAVLAIAALFRTAAPVTRMPVWTALGFPVGAVLLVAGIFRSSLLALRQQGIEWRGTTYPLATLRREADCIAGFSL